MERSPPTPWVTRGVVLCWLAAWAAMTWKGGAAYGPAAHLLGAASQSTLAHGQWWRLLTCLVLHVRLTLLVLDVIVTLTLGAWVERRLGAFRTGLLVVGGALTEALLETHAHRGIVVGSSGAALALAAAAAVLAARRRHKTPEVVEPARPKTRRWRPSPGLTVYLLVVLLAATGGVAAHRNDQLAQALLERAVALPREDARALVERAAALTPQSSAVWVCAGRIRQGGVQEPMDVRQQAFPDFDRAISLNPCDHHALLERAELNKESMRPQEALADATEAAIYDDSAEATARVGMLRFGLDQYEDARQLLLTAATLDPTSEDALFHLVYADLCTHRLQDARDHAQAYLSLPAPRRPVPVGLIGWCASRLLDQADAGTFLESASSKWGRDGEWPGILLRYYQGRVSREALDQARDPGTLAVQRLTFEGLHDVVEGDMRHGIQTLEQAAALRHTPGALDGELASGALRWLGPASGGGRFQAPETSRPMPLTVPPP